MSLELFTSDSDSDLEVLAMLSDWNNSSNSDSSDIMDVEDANISEESDDDNTKAGDGITVYAEKRNGELHTNEEDKNRPLKLRRVNYMQTLEDAEFTFTFRLSKTVLEPLLAEIMPYVRVTSARNNGVTPFHQLLLTLRFYAMGTMLSTVADYVGVAKSTACRIVRDISSAIAMLYDKYVFMHMDGIEKFHRIAKFPKVVGVVDCMHVRIDSPRHDIGPEFRNSQGHFSLNVQAICDADLKIMNIAWQSGSYHDTAVFDNSPLKDEFESGQYKDCWLLGDNDFQNRWYLLTPILNPTTESERRYNDSHAKTRTAIERTFEVWKRRFPVLGLTLRVSLPVIHSIITATAVLHNICIINNVVDVPPESATDEPDSGNIDNVANAENPGLDIDSQMLDAGENFEPANCILDAGNVLDSQVVTGNQLDANNMYNGIDVQVVDLQDVKDFDRQDDCQNLPRYCFDSNDFDMRGFVLNNYFK
ncbi:putative nuclease HARBI1 [Pieris rapae]|uniref:putative nuclease HARBI1 n=1 Tax=Pieris rapae TaxID=64459 RepID=UPI001E27FF60|nr:putative nuclease HARBI1 [Pieris rapae]XP_045489034.1 putative nuclease HARBI1 [Pieris rapae]